MALKLKELLQPPRRLRVTRDGRFFILMTLMAGVAAVNTGNNLLYLLLGMMLGLIVLSGILSEQQLRGLVVKRVPSGELMARSQGSLMFELTNTKRLLPSFSIEVAEHEHRDTRAMRRTALGLPPHPKKARLWGGYKEDGDPGPPRALVIRVSPKSSIKANALAELPRRGLYRFNGIDLVTRFPFGFFEKTRPTRGAGELLVLPHLSSQLARALDDHEAIGELLRAKEGRGQEFFSLREFKEGDDPRDIHWKVSARRQQLVRRTWENEENVAVSLYFYNHLPPSLSGPELDAALESMEQAIEEVAGLAARLTQHNVRVSLSTLSGEVTEGTGPSQTITILRHLALLEILRDDQPPPLKQSGGGFQVLVSTQSTPAEIGTAFERVLSAGIAPTTTSEAAT